MTALKSNFNPKKLSKIQCLITELSIVDSQIIQIQNLAAELASGECKSISLNVVSGKQNGSSCVVSSDGKTMALSFAPVGSGSVALGVLGSIFGVSSRDSGDLPEYKSKKSNDKFDIGISDTASLRVLSIVLEEKLDMKSKLLEKLNKLGIK